MTSACPKCAAALAPGAQRCAACGTPVGIPDPYSAPTLPPDHRPLGAEGTPSVPTLLPGAVTVVGAALPGSGARANAAVDAMRAAETSATLVPGVGAAGASTKSDTGPLTPGRSFGSRYHVKRLVGLGGMGAVYQAWDTELGIDVAIKLIRPESLASPELAAEIQRRFKRELLLARLVSHPNVVRIHDLGEIDGIKYITMSYVDGTDLASLLAQHETLPVRRVVRIARQLVDGLVAAHAAGVIHRDLKPANVMIGRDDAALITDFGIARLGTDADGAERFAPAEPARPSGARYGGYTAVGSMVGTVEYMPPEQARGEPLDPRADVYALGLVLYDMLAGRARSLLAATPLEELEARTKAPPPKLRTLAPQVPEALEALIARCVEPEAAKRFESSAALAAALARLDDDGRRVPLYRQAGAWRLAAAAAVLVAGVGGAWWWAASQAPPPAAPKDPVTLLIADFANGTGDASLDRTLEPVLKLSLEGAEFITAYARSDLRRLVGVQAPERFDAVTAREIAVKQGIGVVVAGTIGRDAGGYRLSLTATQAVTGNVVGVAQEVARDRDAVLASAGALAERIRQALGDDASDSKQRFAMDTLTATSLDVVHDYALAMDALASSRFDDALDSFGKAVERDPQFGLAYAGMAIASANLGRQQDAEKYAAQALQHVERMTERERLRTRGLHSYVTSDYPACVQEYGALLARYKADAAARNNHALCSTRLREMQRALDGMREAVKILPNRALYRVNLALYAAYASDFANAEIEARQAVQMSPLGHVPLGFALLGLERRAEAAQVYAEFAKANALGASHAAAGLGDLATYEGRYDEAVQTLERGVAADRAAGEADRAAAKLVAIAHAELMRDRKPSATAAAERALELSRTAKIRFLAGRAKAQSGGLAAARVLAAGLAAEPQLESRAHAKILEGEIALSEGDAAAAVAALTAANALLDTWIGRYTLGRAYLAAGEPAKADDELERCIARRGEALALFLDEEPSWGMYPLVHYWQGRAREALRAPGYMESYRRYLAIRGTSTEDALVADARRGVGTAR